LSGRLRQAKLGLGGLKYQTNIRYLRSSASIRHDFKRFVHEFNLGSYQLKRLRGFVDTILESGTYAPPSSTTGYANLGRLLAMTVRKPRYLILFLVRLFRLIGNPVRLAYICRAAAMIASRSTPERPLWFYFKFWLFNWSNSLVKYSALSNKDFDIESVPANFDMAMVLPPGYENGEQGVEATSSKAAAQRRLTTQSLKVLTVSHRS
jgi:hypothetical protein